MSFHDIRLPKFIEVFAAGRPEFLTSCARTISGREVRNLDNEYARQKYLIKNCRLSNLEFEQFNSFFRSRRGSNFAFRFRDHLDYQVVKQFIAKGDGACQEFQLTKLYYDPIFPYIRIITKPVPNSVAFYIEDEAVAAEVNYDHGTVRLKRPLDKEQILTSDFTFDVSVRFGNDSFEYASALDGSIELSEIELLEVI